MIQVEPNIQIDQQPTAGTEVFEAVYDGIYSVVVEHVSGAASTLETTRGNLTVAHVASGSFDSNNVYLATGDKLTALAIQTASTINVALVRLGDELFQE